MVSFLSFSLFTGITVVINDNSAAGPGLATNSRSEARPSPVRPSTAQPLIAATVTVGDQELSVSWPQPPAEVTQMVVELRPAKSARVLRTCVSKETSCRFTELINGMRYQLVGQRETTSGRSPAFSKAGIPEPKLLSDAALALRLDANSTSSVQSAAGRTATDGESVSIWQNSAADVLSARAAKLGPQAPTSGTFRGLPVVVFAGAARLSTLAPALPVGAESAEVYFVAAPSSDSPNCTDQPLAWGYNSPGNDRILRSGCASAPAVAARSAQSGGLSPAEPASWDPSALNLLVASFGKTSTSAWLNRQSAPTQTDSPGAAVPEGSVRLGIGGDPWSPQDDPNRWSGQIAEILIFNRILAARDRALITKYLDLKWELSSR